MVQQCRVVICSKLKHGKGTSYGSCDMKSYYTTAAKLHFTAPNVPKISFGTVNSMCGTTKRFTTTRKSCLGKAPGRKLKSTDNHVYFVDRCLKISTWQLQSL